MENREIARHLDEVADLLAVQAENPFRVAAYRRAAATLRGLDRRAEEVLRAQGRAGLTRLVGIGESLAATIFAPTISSRITAKFDPTFPYPCTAKDAPFNVNLFSFAASRVQIAAPLPVADSLPRDPPTDTGFPVTTAGTM